MKCNRDNCMEKDRADRLLDQLRFHVETMNEIFELSDPRSKTPCNNTELIRIKSGVAVRQATKSGLL